MIQTYPNEKALSDEHTSIDKAFFRSKNKLYLKLETGGIGINAKVYFKTTAKLFDCYLYLGNRSIFRNSFSTI